MTELAQRVADAQDPRRATLTDLVERMRPEFAKVLPAHLPTDAFLRLTLTELRTNRLLLQCSPESLLGSLMTAARLGLEPGGPLGQMYLIPRRLKDKGWTVVPMIGYAGLRDLAYRSGVVQDVSVQVIRSGDRYEEGANESRGLWFEWSPIRSPFETDDEVERPIVGVFGVARLTTGGTIFRRLTLREVLERKDRGSAGDSGPWSTDFEAMVRKTGLRALASLLPKSAGLMLVEQVDEQPVEVRPPGVDLPLSEEPAPDAAGDEP